jgi:Flp pilus assembly protein TadD
MRSLALCLFLASFSLFVWPAAAQEMRVPLPKKSKYTPVQELNRDGVKALQKHQIDKAKRLFYKAYLLDPNDPFTLNNLGYMAEVEGDLDRAQRYYDQSEANTSEAIVDQSTEKLVEGKPVAKIAGQALQGPMQVNQLNRQAVRFLSQDRAPEADLILQQALKIDPNNPFTLNNLGFAKEKEGELEEAIKLYSRAAATRSREPVVVTSNKDWRGKAISEVADRNAEKTHLAMVKEAKVDDQVARLNMQGVSAMNRNDRKTAREDFQKAFKLDPRNSFTINNMGFLAEMDGDKETAQSYYRQAQTARRSSNRVAAATRTEAEGRAMGLVAEQSTALVDSYLQATADAKRRTGGAPVLRTRDNKVVKEKPANPNVPTTPGTPYTPPEFRQPPQNQQQNPPELKKRPPENQ